MVRTPSGNLVLDIDGTLIDSLPEERGHLALRPPDYISQWGDYIYFRPHLESFLLYAFMRFENVAIWTAASPEWAETVVTALQPILRRIRRQINYKRTGSFECVRTPRAANRAKADADDDSDATGDNGNNSYALPTEDIMFSFVYTKSRCQRKAVADVETQLLYEYHTKPLRKVWRRNSMRKLGWSPKNTLILEDTPQNCISNYGNALYIRTFDTTDGSVQDSALLILQSFLDRLRHVDDVRTIEKRDWERLCAATMPRKLRPLHHSLSVGPTATHELASSAVPRNSDGQLFAAVITPRSRNTSKYNPISHHHNDFYPDEDSESDYDDSAFSCENDSSDAETDSGPADDFVLDLVPCSESDSDSEDDVPLIVPRRRSLSLMLQTDYLPLQHSNKPVLPFQAYKLNPCSPRQQKQVVDNVSN